MREVELEVLLEALTLLLGEDHVDHLSQLSGRHQWEVDEFGELAIDPDRGVLTRREVEVRSLVLQEEQEELVDVDARLLCD